MYENRLLVIITEAQAVVKEIKDKLLVCDGSEKDGEEPEQAGTRDPQ